MNAAFFTALKTAIETIKDGDGSNTFKTIRKWNNQLELLMTEEGARIYMYTHPAIFIAFNTSVIQQLGNGIQLYDPLFFDIHIMDWQLDAGDGTFEQNLTVYDLKKKVYKALQKLQPGLTDESDPAGSCIRIAEEEDNNHRGVTHYIQKYKTTWVDNDLSEPVGGVEWVPDPMPVQIDMSDQETVGQASAYDPNIQYLAVNQTYVSYQGSIYIIKTDTPNPAGAFNASLWTYISPNPYNYIPA